MTTIPELEQIPLATRQAISTSKFDVDSVNYTYTEDFWWKFDSTDKKLTIAEKSNNGYTMLTYVCYEESKNPIQNDPTKSFTGVYWKTKPKKNQSYSMYENILSDFVTDTTYEYHAIDFEKRMIYLINTATTPNTVVRQGWDS
jgi:hypothetical protein